MDGESRRGFQWKREVRGWSLRFMEAPAVGFPRIRKKSIGTRMLSALKAEKK